MWHPKSVPKWVSWPYYIVLVLCVFWFTFWITYYAAVQYNLAVAILHGIDQFIFSLLWIIFPYVLSHKAESLVNTIDYVVRERAAPMNLLNVGYAVLFAVILSPQIVYFALEGVPYIRDSIAPTLPWNKSVPSASLFVVDTAILSLGMLLNILCINVTLLYLGMAAHLQSFQINNFLSSHLLHRTSTLNISQVKSVLHLSVQSLRKGNNEAEPLNSLIVMGILLEIVEVVTKIIINDKWDAESLLPLGIMVIQVLFFLVPPAYVTRCWDRAFHKLLSLHALALNKEDELGSIIIYMKEAYRGYTISGFRVDFHFILYFCYGMVCLMAIKAQRDVHFWMPNK